MDATETMAMLRDLSACRKATDWAKGKGLDEIWQTCERPDWMLWLAARRLPCERVVLAACACARTALKFVPAGEDRPRIAIETAERWARGEATLDEVRKARSAAAAAYAAAYAAYAASAAAYAADAASDAADAAAYAADAAAYAADAAAYAADAASDAYAARSKAKREMCNLIRGLISAQDIIDATD